MRPHPTRSVKQARCLSSAATATTVAPRSSQHFYMNKILDEYVTRKPTPITLRQLIFYERHRNKDRVLRSANYIRTELPIRISHRIREFQQLPFIVGSNPHIQHVYELYWKAFDRLRRVGNISTIDENMRFCELLNESLEAHLVVIPRLALGISECEHHIETDRINRFMNAVLRSRISRRMLAEQHLILSQFSHGSPTSHGAVSQDAWRTTVFSSCSAHDTVRQCAELARSHHAQAMHDAPNVVLGGQTDDVRFTYVSDHIEYILYQTLANSIRHTMATHPPDALPPIHVTVSANATDVFFRISDQGGGIPDNIHRHLWSYGNRPHQPFENFRHIPLLAAKVTEHDHLRTPLGIGLPMSRVYAEYWGGDIHVLTMHGWGTDAYVRIPRLGTQSENLDASADETTRSSWAALEEGRRPGFVV